MFLDIGEWWHSNVAFSIVFTVALLGVMGIGFYVVRAATINREGMDDTDELNIEK